MSDDEQCDAPTPSMPGMPSTDGIGREKYWNELSIEGKIERTREQVKQNHHLIDRLMDDNDYLRANFENHSHSEGVIVRPIDRDGLRLRGRRLTPNRKPGEEYF